MKKSFLLYSDQHDPIKALSLEQKGLLFENIFLFQNGHDVDILDPVVNMAFSFFKQVFDRDESKYLERCEKNRENAKKRWEKNNANNANACDGMRPDAKHADNDNDNDNGSDSDNDSDNEKEVKEHTPEIKKFVNSFIEYISETHDKTAPKKTKSLFKNSYDSVEKLIRIDKFELSEIRFILNWATKDTGNGSWSGWAGQVKSLVGLRKKKESGGLTKFQKIADSYNKQKNSTGCSRTDANIKAAEAFVNNDW